MSSNEGGPAFPLQGFDCAGQNNVLQYPEHGMTLRDYFAAKAMQSLVSTWGPLAANDIAVSAYKFADAMLKAREGNS